MQKVVFKYKKVFCRQKKKKGEGMEDNIIKFKNKNKITESEINGLFLGLVKLIKKLAMEEAVANLPKEERESFDEKQELQRKLLVYEGEIDRLKKEREDLKQKIKVKNLKILQLSCSKAKCVCEQK